MWYPGHYRYERIRLSAVFGPITPVFQQEGVMFNERWQNNEIFNADPNEGKFLTRVLSKQLFSLNFIDLLNTAETTEPLTIEEINIIFILLHDHNPYSYYWKDRIFHNTVWQKQVL